MREDKNKLRAAVRAAGGAVADGSAVVDEIIVAGRIEALPEFAAARTVALYCSLPDEVPTDGMLRCWLGRKRLALPVVSDDGSMVFREYTGGESLSVGAFGIRGPVGEREITPEGIDLMLVPGVAFDAGGRRLGRGGGFYDRYLARADAAHIYKVGLCRARALVDEVPAEAHDVRMDKIITNG